MEESRSDILPEPDALSESGAADADQLVPYLVLSIICTLCCCLPFGIVGIVYAAKINSSMAAGNYEEAKMTAKSAKIWIIASAVVGLIVEVIYIIFAFIGGVGGYYYY